MLSEFVHLILLQDLIKKLDEVTQNSEIVEIRQKEAECELEAARDRVQQQATEILLKASKTHLSPHTLVPTAHVMGCVMQTHQTDLPADPLIDQVIASATLTV